MQTKKPLLSVLFVLLLYGSFAQDITLKGLVKNESGQPLPAEVIVTTAKTDSILKTGYFENGVITITGISFKQFTVKISSFNHEEKVILVDAVGAAANLGEIILSNIRKLENVTVRAKAPLFKRTAEGTRVNVEGTMLSSSISAADVLSKSPGVTVSKNNLSIFGKGAALIYLNGKPITYEQMLSIPVSRIKSVDIITNPSAKYEAKGMAVVNIITKKGTGPEGFMGEVTESLTFARHLMNDAALNLNYKKKKLSLTADYSSEQGTDWLRGNLGKKFSYNFGDYTTQTVHEENTYNAMNTYRFGLNYALTKKSDISVQYDGLYNEYDLGVDIRNYNTDPYNSITRVNVFNNGFTGNYNHSLNANYNLSLDSNGSNMFIGTQFSRFHNVLFDRIKEDINKDGVDQPEGMRVNDGDNLFTLFTMQADLTKMMHNGNKVEAGVRLSEISNEGRVIFKSKLTTDNDYVISDQLSNSSIYHEKVPAAYLQYYGNASEKFTYAAGMRMEMSMITADSRKTNTRIVDDNYYNFFPNVQLNYTISDKWSSSLSYSGRINRPIYQNLDPFVWYLDSLTSIQGNPTLKPELINSVEGNISYKSFNLKLNYTRVKNTMQSVSLPGPNGVNSALYTTQNLQKLEHLNASLEIPFQVKIWSSYNMLAVNLDKITDERPDFKSLGTTPQLYVYSYQQLKFPKLFNLDITGQYFGNKKNGLNDNKASWFVNAGISRSFFNKKLSVNIVGEDIFRTRKFTGYTTLGHITNTFDSRSNSHLLRLTLKYKFGGLKSVTYKNKTLNDDEFNRIRQ